MKAIESGLSKQKALEACETSVVGKEGYEKAAALQDCRCIAEERDYSLVLAGDEEKIKTDVEKSSLACAMKGAM